MSKSWPGEVSVELNAGAFKVDLGCHDGNINN